jgi:hypothetical protein
MGSRGPPPVSRENGPELRATLRLSKLVCFKTTWAALRGCQASWPGLSPDGMAFKAKGCRHRAVAIPIVAVAGLWSALAPALAAIRVVDALGGQAMPRLGWWPRLPTRYGTGTGPWLRRRWSTRSSRASRRESWPQLRSPTTWDRTPRSSMRSAAPMPWLWRRARPRT